MKRGTNPDHERSHGPDVSARMSLDEACVSGLSIGWNQPVTNEGESMAERTFLVRLTGEQLNAAQDAVEHMRDSAEDMGDEFDPRPPEFWSETQRALDEGWEPIRTDLQGNPIRTVAEVEAEAKAEIVRIRAATWSKEDRERAVGPEPGEPDYRCEECDEEIAVSEDTPEGGVPLVCTACYRKATK